jgi:hypothetical protein
MRSIFFQILTAAAITGLILVFVFAGQREEEQQEAKQSTLQVITPVPVPDSASFAGEGLPMEYFYVREQLERELTVNTYWHSSTLLLLKRANRWLPVIEPILEANGVPDDFKYIAMIESNLTNTVSPAGAAGFWQFLEGTAREYGLTVNKEVDERYHLEKATEKACRYIKEAREKYGSWTMAAIAYNAGMNRVSSVVGKQGSANYFELNLSEETSRYIYRAVAIKEITLHPEKYGYILRPEDLYQAIPFRELTIDTTISDLGGFARAHGINYRLLKELNPWLIDSKITVIGPAKYTIRIATI